jgi:uncharacterized repeat protein (TIGR01451 family)
MRIKFMRTHRCDSFRIFRRAGAQIWLMLCLLALASEARAVVDANKAFNPINRSAGQTASLVITLFNTAVVPATSAAITDTMPAAISVTTILSNSCGGTASANGTQLVLVGGSIPAAAGAGQGSCSVSAVVTALAPGSHVNTLRTTDVNSSEGNAIQDAQATLNVAQLAPLTGAKTVPVSAELHGGGTRAFVITLNNPNFIALTGLGFTDTLPATLRVAPGGVLSNTCGGAVVDQAAGAVDDGDTQLRLSGGSIPASSSCSVSFAVRPANDSAAFSGNVTNSIPAAGITTTEAVSNAAAVSGNIALRTGAFVTKAFAPSTILEGGVSTLTLTLNNRNLSSITAINFADIMPPGISVTAVLSNTCGGSINAPPASSVQLTGGALAAAPNANTNSFSQCTITVQVTAPTQGNFLNNITAGTFGTPNTAYPAASATLLVLQASPVSVSKAFAPATTVHTGTSLLSITLNNTGAVPAAITTFTDNLLTMGNVAVRIEATPAPITTCAGSLSAPAGTTTIVLTGGVIPANGACLIQVAVRAEPNGLGGGRTNAVPSDGLVTSVGNNENTATAVLTINAALTAAKAYSPNVVAPGGLSRLNVTLTHAAFAVPFTDLSFVDNLPAGHALGTPPNATNSCGGVLSAVAGSNSFSLTGGSLPAGSSLCVVAVDVVAPGTVGSATNSITAGSVTTAEGARSRAAATAVLTRTNSAPSVTLNKAFTPVSVNGGAVSQLQITIANNAVGAVALSSVSLTDTLPTGMLISGSGTAALSGAGCSLGVISAVPGAGSVGVTGVSIAAGSVCVLTAPVIGIVDGNLINVIPVGALSSAQSVSNQNSPAATLTVLRNLNVQKAFLASPIQAGGTSTLLITLINSNEVNRNGTATNTFTDNLPAGMSLQSGAASNTCGGTLSDGSGGALGAGATSIRLNGGFFAAGSSCTISVVVTVPTSGTFLNTIAAGSVTTAEGSTNPDPASALLRAVSGPTIAKSFIPASIQTAQSSVLTLVLSNPNSAALLPGGLTGVSFSDNLPVGMTVASSGALTGSCGGVGSNIVSAGATSLSVSGVTIAAGGTCSVTVSVVTSAQGNFPNQTSGVTSAQTPVPSASSNIATLTVIAAASMSKSFSPSSVVSGGTGTSVLTIVLTNPNATAVLIASPGVTDALPTSPAAMLVASPLNASNTCGGTLVDSAGGALAAADAGVRLNGGSIPPNGSCTVSVTVLAPAPGSYLNTSSVLNTLNAGLANAATALFTVTPEAFLSVTKTNTGTTLTAGQTTVYAITVNNAGPASASGTRVLDTPTGLVCTVLTCSATGGASCPAGVLDPAVLSSVGYLIPLLPASSSVEFLLECGVAATGQ